MIIKIHTFSPTGPHTTLKVISSHLHVPTVTVDIIITILKMDTEDMLIKLYAAEYPIYFRYKLDVGEYLSELTGRWTLQAKFVRLSNDFPSASLEGLQTTLTQAV